MFYVLEGSSLTRTVLPFGVLSLAGTKQKIKRADMFTYQKARSNIRKPWELYSDLIDLYGEERGWIMDLCSGSGKSTIII